MVHGITWTPPVSKKLSSHNYHTKCKKKKSKTKQGSFFSHRPMLEEGKENAFPLFRSPTNAHVPKRRSGAKIALPERWNQFAQTHLQIQQGRNRGRESHLEIKEGKGARNSDNGDQSERLMSLPPVPKPLSIAGNDTKRALKFNKEKKLDNCANDDDTKETKATAQPQHHRHSPASAVEREKERGREQTVGDQTYQPSILLLQPGCY